MKHKPGQTFLITGACRGLGRAFARAFAGQARLLILTCRDREHLQPVKEEIGRQHKDCEIRTVGGDLATEAGIQGLVKEIGDEALESVDVLVNNAGFAEYGSLVDVANEAVVKQVFINLIAPVFLAKKVLPAMIQRRKGRILNISSIGAIQLSKSLSVYRASKLGLNGFTHALSAEASPYGITVNAIMPGFMHTEAGAAAISFFRRAHPEWSEEDVMQRIKLMAPNQSIVELNDVANLAQFLISDEAQPITGQIIAMAGGL